MYVCMWVLISCKKSFQGLSSFLLLCVKLQYAVDICFQNAFCVINTHLMSFPHARFGPVDTLEI